MTQTYEGTHLTGLDGTNPLGFFAALGVQVLFADESDQPKLWWSNDVIPHAIVSESCSVEKIVDQATAVFPKWARSPALAPSFNSKDEQGMTDAKFTKEGLRQYLDSSVNKAGETFATALVAEGSYAIKSGQQVAKPTDLYFTAAKMQFLEMAEKILNSVEPEEVAEGLKGEWQYQSKLPSFMWDVVDDRIYALSATDPAGDKKLTNPGPEALAILGISQHPVFAGRDRKGKDRTLTRGCSGDWKQGEYTWPLWANPAGLGAVAALLAQATDPNPAHRSNWYPSWGIFKVLQSQIRRSDPGGFGNFSPPRIIWRTSA